MDKDQSSGIPDVVVTVDGFTVSYSFDVYQGGLKSSNFVSMNFKTSRPVTPEEAVILEVTHSSIVTDAAVYDALARGAIDTETANDLIRQSRERHTKIAQKLTDKLK